MLIKGHSNDLKKDETYFKGTIVLTFLQSLCCSGILRLALAFIIFSVVPQKSDLYLNEDELSAVILSKFPSSL